jgi:hypothetical protein
MTRERHQRSSAQPVQGEGGFSLIETVVAMGILATGLLSLAGVFALGLNHVASSSPALIAREKAREAVESVHTARDTRTIVWDQIRNVADGGVFVSGVQDPIRMPGNDGLVNTADDNAAEVEMQRSPGTDGILGNEDDVLRPLSTYTRQIEISPLLKPDGTINPILRQVRVTIGYQVGSARRTYVLTTYISAIS